MTLQKSPLPGKRQTHDILIIKRVLYRFATITAMPVLPHVLYF